MNPQPTDASMSRAEERAYARGFKAGEDFRTENPPKKWRELAAAARAACNHLLMSDGQSNPMVVRLLRALEKVGQ